jgi:hypothetical protein
LGFSSGSCIILGVYVTKYIFLHLIIMITLNKNLSKVSWVCANSLVFFIAICSTAFAGESRETYKMRLGVNASIGSADMWNLNGKEANEEWVVITVKDKK